MQARHQALLTATCTSCCVDLVVLSVSNGAGRATYALDHHHRHNKHLTTDVLCAYWSSLDASADSATQNSMTSDIAGSVGARGFMLCNRHQAPRTFLALDAPVQFAVQRAMEANEQQMAAVARGQVSGLRQWATEMLPMAKRMCAAAAVDAAVALLPHQWSTVRECIGGASMCGVEIHTKDLVLQQVLQKNVVTHQPRATAAAMVPHQAMREDHDDDDDAIEESDS